MAGPVKNALDAENAAREFLAGRMPWSTAAVNHVSRAEGKWTVRGSHRLPGWFYWAPFTVEIDAASGEIVGFAL